MEKMRILIIDDNLENINLLTNLLSAFSEFEVYVATSGEKGLERANIAHPHIILLDILMPGIDGYEVCTRLKLNKSTVSIPVIFVSAMSEVVDKVKAFNVGGADYITKPFFGEELIARIRTHLSTLQLQMELLKANELLEQKVSERNAELVLANEELLLEVEDRKNAEAFALRAVKEWEETFDALPDQICIIDKQHTILRANRAMTEHNGYNYSGRLSGIKCFQCMHNSNAPIHTCPHQKLLKDNQPHREEHFDENTGHYYVVNVIPLFDANGELYASVHSAHDITNQKYSELIIKESEEKFKNIFHSSNDEILITDLRGNILEINPKASNRFGKSVEDCVSENIAEMVHPSRRQEFLIFFKKIKSMRTGSFETESVKTQGEKSFLEINVKVIKYKRREAILVVSRDITERKIIHQRIVSSIIETEEKERSRIARELHDGIGPLLSMIKLYIQWLNRPDSITSKEEIALQADSTINEAIESVREISNNLSPNVLTNYGLRTAVESFCKKIKNANGLQITSNIRTPENLKKELEVMLYRVINESINNTLKYAQAKEIFIEVDYVDNLLAMVYKDDGIGFLINEILASPKGNGLLNIKNRVETLGGTVNFSSKPGEGMRLSILFQL